MRLSKYIAIISVFTFSLSAYAQMTSVQTKKLKLRALEMALKYESACGISNEDQKDDFIKLFENDEVEIVNDVLPENRLESKTTVRNYVDLIPSYFTYSLRISFVPYDVILTETNSNEGVIEVYGLKSISGRENKSEVVYYDTLDIKLVMKYNNGTGALKIVGISLMEEPTRYLILNAKGKTIFSSKPLKSDSLLINTKLYVTSDNGEVFLRKIDMNSNITVAPTSELYSGVSKISSAQIDKAIRSSSNKNMVTAPFYVSILDITPMIGFIPWGGSPISYENTNNDNINSIEFGANLGIKIQETQKGYWKAVTGIFSFNYEYRSQFAPQNYSYQSIDPDGSGYIRNISIDNYVETSTVSGISIPLLLEKGFNYKKKFGFYLNGGMSFNKINKSESKSTANGAYSGLYPDLFNLIIKENGVYDFGTYELTQSNTLKPTSSFWAVQFGLGSYYKLSKKTNIVLGLAYKQNLNDLFVVDNQILSKSPDELNSLNAIGQKSELKAIIINIGIQFKI